MKDQLRPLKCQLEESQANLNQVDIQIQNLYKEQRELKEKHNLIASEYCLKSGLLGRCKWKADINFNQLIISTDISCLPQEMIDLLNPNYYCVIYLSEKVDLIFNDERVTLRFPKESDAIKFMLDHNIKLDTSNIKTLIKDNKRMVDLGENIMRQLK